MQHWHRLARLAPRRALSGTTGSLLPHNPLDRTPSISNGTIASACASAWAAPTHRGLRPPSRALTAWPADIGVAARSGSGGPAAVLPTTASHAVSSRSSRLRGTQSLTRAAWPRTASGGGGGRGDGPAEWTAEMDLDTLRVNGQDVLCDTNTGQHYDLADFVEHDRLTPLLSSSPPLGDAAGGTDGMSEFELAAGGDGQATDGWAAAGEGAAAARDYSDEDFAPWNLDDDTVGLDAVVSRFARPEVPTLTSLDDVWECPLVRSFRPSPNERDVSRSAVGPGEWCPSEVVTLLLEEQADDVVVIELDKRSRDATGYADFVIVASGRSKHHLSAMAQRLHQQTKARNPPKTRVGGETVDTVRSRAFDELWIVVGPKPCIVHLFLPEARAYYDLEELWRPSDDDDATESDEDLL